MAFLLQKLQDSFAQPAAMPASTVVPPVHPYYPIEAQIVGYLANEWNTLELCSMFAAGCAAIFSVTYVIVKRVRPSTSSSDLLTILFVSPSDPNGSATSANGCQVVCTVYVECPVERRCD
jgi:cholestenol delta-isomerase